MIVNRIQITSFYEDPSVREAARATGVNLEEIKIAARDDGVWLYVGDKQELIFNGGNPMEYPEYIKKMCPIIVERLKKHTPETYSSVATPLVDVANLGLF